MRERERESTGKHGRVAIGEEESNIKHKIGLVRIDYGMDPFTKNTQTSVRVAKFVSFGRQEEKKTN